ncbi:Cupin type-2 domain-containing protein [Bordetella sputigena]|uniref:cupin domain-containing protein n=1 Tax=Bordetella sputigena TaxID=1416810 RepID=UPI0039EFF14C
MEIIKGLLGDTELAENLRVLLPKQGCIEVQRDAPGKEHRTHSHPTDETLIIVDGALTVYADGVNYVCRKGDVIDLPAGTVHGSTASSEGAIYLIAFERLAPSIKERSAQQCPA